MKKTNPMRPTPAATAEDRPAEKEAPGVRGFYKALKDEETWRALAPLLLGVMTLGEGLRKPAPEKPISALTEKPSNA